MRTFARGWLAAATLLAAGCGESAGEAPAAACSPWRPFDRAQDGDYATYTAGGERARCPKPWTVLVYMAADVEDLPTHALADVREMEDAQGAASSARADVIVQLDLPGPPGLRRYHLFSRTGDAAPEERTPSSPEVALVSEVDGPPGDPLAEFIAWGRAHYPSERLMVVLWGHGQGWRPRVVDAEPVRYVEGGFVGGFGFDHGQSVVLDIPTLVDALRRGSPDRPIDVLVTDACLMQSVDVAGALAGAARHLVGHEQVDPYAGFSYDRVIPLVNGERSPPTHPACPDDDEACRVAVELPALMSAASDSFVASAASADALQAALLPALARLSTALIAFLDEDRLRASDIQARMISHVPGEGLPGFAGNTADLGVLLTRLRQEAQEEQTRCTPACPAVSALIAALDEAERSLDAAVLSVAFGPVYAEDDAYAWTPGPAGLSVWLPPRAEQLNARRAAFTSSPASGWLPWLDRLHAAP